MKGIINILKPTNMTSFDVIAYLRKLTGEKRIGHTGTLDPMATGVLPVCIGKATRLIEYLKDDKAYKGIVQLGSSTTTYDIEGEIVNVSDNSVTKEDIDSVLDSFRGEIEQLPPIYSAIKVGGKKLYEYAREGKEVDVQPRRVNIKEIKILNYDENSRQLELYIGCSKGTYIRSIANDLGEKLGTYGHLIKLVRVQAGDFDIENSVKLEDLENMEIVRQHLIEPVKMLDYPKYELSPEELEKVSHGMNIEPSDMALKSGTILLMHNNELAAIGDLNNGVIKCNKVFI